MKQEIYYDDHKKPAMRICEITETTTKITIKSTIVKTIEVSHDMGIKIMDMNREERNVTRKETRRHISLEDFDIIDEIASSDEPILDYICRMEDYTNLYKAIETLPDEQQQLVHRIFWLNEKQADIAVEEGVSKAAIHYRLQIIFRKLKNFLEKST